jgi:hypothetical protein
MEAVLLSRSISISYRQEAVSKHRGRATDQSLANCCVTGYFLVKFPDNWSASERYDFDWQTLQNDPEPFQNFAYREADAGQAASQSLDFIGICQHCL